MKSISNEVLYEKIIGLERLINERFSENNKEHSAIIAQTTKTNGKVIILQEWMNTSKGAIAILGAVILPVMFYLLYLHIE